MRMVGEVIMIAAALALIAVGLAYRWSDRPLREFLRSGERRLIRPHFGLKFLDEYSAWTVFLPLIVLLGVGWMLRHYG